MLLFYNMSHLSFSQLVKSFTALVFIDFKRMECDMMLLTHLLQQLWLIITAVQLPCGTFSTFHQVIHFLFYLFLLWFCHSRKISQFCISVGCFLNLLQSTEQTLFIWFIFTHRGKWAGLFYFYVAENMKENRNFSISSLPLKCHLNKQLLHYKF